MNILPVLYKNPQNVNSLFKEKALSGIFLVESLQTDM